METDDLIARLRSALQAEPPLSSARPLDDALRLFPESAPEGASGETPGSMQGSTVLPEVLGEIARGGMGVILRVYDPLLERDLAMKVVRLDQRGPVAEEACRRLRSEAKITAQLDHPGVVPVHQLGYDAAGRPCFTMKLVAGVTLDAVMEEVREGRGGWTLLRLVQVLLRVCETLAFAHSRGIVHRDVKPANVMVGSFGETYVMDWGLAKAQPDPEASAADSLLEPEATLSGQVMGTPSYMAPEQAMGTDLALDPRLDVYSLGALLYQALARVAPYADRGISTGFAMVEAVRGGPPTPLERLAPEAPPELRAIAQKAMARDRNRRYADAAAMGADLQRWLEGRVVLAHRTGLRVEFAKWVARNRALALACAVALLVAVGGTVALVLVQRDASIALASERDATLAQARRAEGLRLAAAAVAGLGDDAALSFELARRGAELAPGHQADQALLAVLESYRPCHVLLGHESPVTGLRHSPDGTKLATFERDQPLGILWDVASGRELARLDHHDLPIADLAWSPDGQRLATVSADGTLRITELAQPTSSRALTRGRALRSVAWSANGEELLIADVDGSVRLIDAEQDGVLTTLATHRGGAIAARFQPRGELVMSAGADGRVSCCRKDGSVLVEVEVPNCVEVAWSPCGSWIRVRTQKPNAERLLVVDPQIPVPAALSGEARRIWFAEDGTCAVLVPLVGNEACLWNRASGASKTLPVDLGTDICAIEPAQRLLTVVSRYDIRVLDLDFGRDVARLRGHLYNPSALALRDGILASASLDRTTRLWQLEPYGSRLMRLPQGKLGNEIAALFPDRSLAVFLSKPSGDGVAPILDYRCARVHAALEPPPVKPRVVRVCQSEGTFAIGCEEGVAIYEVETGLRRALVPRALIGNAEPLAWSPRGDLLLLQSWPGPIWLVDPRTGEARVSHELPTNAGRCAISPDGAHVAYAAGLNFTRGGLWHLASGRKLPLPEHSGTLIGFAFSPDGTQVVSAAVDGSIKVAEVATARLLATVAGLPVTTDPPYWSSDGRWISIGERVIATDTWIHALTVPRSARSVFRGFTADGTHLVRQDEGGRLRCLPLRPAEHSAGLHCPAPRMLDLQRLEVGTPAEREALARDSAANQPSAAVHHRDGVSALAEGELDRAISSLRRALEISPRRPARQVDLAVALLRRAKERPTTSESDFEAACAAVRAALAGGDSSTSALLQRSELEELRRHPRWAELEAGR